MRGKKTVKTKEVEEEEEGERNHRRERTKAWEKARSKGLPVGVIRSGALYDSFWTDGFTGVGNRPERDGAGQDEAGRA